MEAKLQKRFTPSPLQCSEKAASFMLLYLMLHKLEYIVHHFEMKGRDRWVLNRTIPLNCPPSPLGYEGSGQYPPLQHTIWSIKLVARWSQPLAMSSRARLGKSMTLSVPESSRFEQFVLTKMWCPISLQTPSCITLQVFGKVITMQEIL